MLVEITVQAFTDFDGRVWVLEQDGTDLQCGRARDEHLGGVLPAGDTAQPDNGNFDRLRRLPNHTDRNGKDRRAGEPARIVAQDGAPCFNIDTHAGKRIN